MKLRSIIVASFIGGFLMIAMAEETIYAVEIFPMTYDSSNPTGETLVTMQATSTVWDGNGPTTYSGVGRG